MEDIISFLKTVDTPTICNAIEMLEVRAAGENFTSSGIKCLFPEFGPMVGYAVTAQMETVTEMEERDPQLTMDFYEAIVASPKPAVIVMQEIGAYREFAAHTGEIMTTLLLNFGAIGLVTDCNVRDYFETKALGFHTFAAGLSPSHVNCRFARVGVPVQVHGMTVRQGDIVHGDVNGLVQIPYDRIDELPAKIAQVRQIEGDLMSKIRAGGYTLDDLREAVMKVK